MKIFHKLSAALLITLATILAVSQHASAALIYIVDARANSSSGSGVGLNTGLALTSGDNLWVTASGCWSAGATDARNSDADGIIHGASNPCSNGAPGIFGQHSQAGLTANFGSLVGSLDSGSSFFVIGTSFNQAVTQSGTLSLYYWDSNSSDNTGTVTVTIHDQDKDIPEPGMLGLLGGGLIGLALMKRRRKN